MQRTGPGTKCLKWIFIVPIILVCWEKTLNNHQKRKSTRKKITLTKSLRGAYDVMVTSQVKKYYLFIGTIQVFAIFHLVY